MAAGCGRIWFSRSDRSGHTEERGSALRDLMSEVTLHGGRGKAGRPLLVPGAPPVSSRAAYAW
jgi:hypothetical protein